MNEIPRHSVSVAAAIVNERGHGLAIQRHDNGHWEPPGGILEYGETLEQCLHREVEEETGLHIEVDRLTGIYQNLTRNVVAFVFRCRPIGGALRVTAETQDAAWLTADEITRRMDEAYAVRLHDALNDPQSAPIVRAHDGVHLIAA
jgi:ADP-ribose pyrophosphatase YjhB (NUDIX family)